MKNTTTDEGPRYMIIVGRGGHEELARALAFIKTKRNILIVDDKPFTPVSLKEYRVVPKPTQRKNPFLYNNQPWKKK